jgi:hypothetical protein
MAFAGEEPSVPKKAARVAVGRSRMFDVQLFLPALAQVLLTSALAIFTASGRWSAAAKRQVRVGDIALGQKAWPDQVQKFSNAFNNQWETPILLYVGLGFAMIAGQGGPVLVGLAWIYVATRLVHAFIYVTSNYIPHRFAAFVAGFTALMAFWGVLAWRVLV